MKSPSLLIHSGTHGDEYGVIESVRLAVEKYREKLPNYVFIPIVSPSAVAKKTRINSDGVDLNRSFFDDSPIDEVKTNIEIVKTHGPFDLCVTFHEEPELPDFYMYQSAGSDLTFDPRWLKFKKEIKAMGIGLLNGIDAPLDPVLKNEFIDGYRYFPRSKDNMNESGEFDCWAINRNFLGSALIPEIPMYLDQKMKNKIVDLFFQHLLLKY